MSGAPFEGGFPTPLRLLAALAALVLSGLAVRLMDDALDVPYDTALGRTTLGGRLGRSAAAYALAALAAACALDVRLAVAAFAAAYAIGMGREPKTPLPSGLPAWAESLCAFVVAMLSAGVAGAAGLLFAMGAIQIGDDLLDAHREAPLPAANLAHRLGRPGAALLGLGLLALALWIAPVLSALCLCAVPALA
ncbi:MAG TPA: hypothetical protein VFK80_03515, partial [Limnochordia bacterium]|nr:hypothetical protein [Limnochordia bacterium]